MAMSKADLEKLAAEARRAPEDIQQALLKVLSSGASEDTRPVTARALRALGQVIAAAPRSAILEAVGKSSDVASLATLLQEAGPALSTDEPLAGAFLRGVAARDELLAAEGGVLTAEQTAQVLRLQRQAVDNRRKAGRLLAVWAGRRGYLYPAWQFTTAGQVLDGLEATLAELRETQVDPWLSLAFFVRPHLGLGGRPPLQALRAGEVALVRRLAASFGEQGAA
jgi:hypothetical protein